jgi:hypothetical protein
MKIKHIITIYNKNYPNGINKTVTSIGEPCEKPSYLMGCDNHIFLRDEKNIIHIIDINRIIYKK